METAGLSGRRTLALDAAGEGTAILVEVTTREMVDTWSRARAVVSSTGRWPILLTSPGPALDWPETFVRADPFSRWPYDGEKPSELIRRAKQVDIERHIEELMAPRRTLLDEEGESRLRSERGKTDWACGAAPGEEELRQIYKAQGDIGLQRHLLAWEMARGCKVDLRYQDWFTPPWQVALALLPAGDPWNTYAYVHTLFEADHAMLVSAARRWHERYGAEPVAAFGTVAQLLVGKRPEGQEDALRLAVEHVSLAIDTIGPPGIALRWHAQALLQLDRWQLHRRP